jgi:hypothetical protein
LTPAGCRDFRDARTLSRRRWLQLGGLGVLGVGLPDLLAAQAAAQPARPAAGFGRARSCILLFMWGGPSHLDTWDLKPEAPAEVRGAFRPIATSVPGTRISEHFPLLAQRAHRYAILRSLTHDDPAHLSSVHHLMTGRHAPRVRSDVDPPSRRDTPHVGSVLALLRPTGSAVPPFVTIPWIVSHPAAPGGKAPGQNAGWLGPGYDPLVLNGDPAAPDFGVADTLGRAAGVSDSRLQDRRALLGRINPAGPTSVWQERALDLLSSPVAQRAFDLGTEPAAVRDRYGRHTHGQAVLLARRLIEAGVRLVCVNWHNDGQTFWDTHANNFNGLSGRLMPPADRAFAALLDDLHQRGLLDETLVVWVGEFGRAPRISAGNAGREHWPFCYSGVLAGGGVRGGLVHGRSDRQGAYPAENPVPPHDLTATIYQALGVAQDHVLRDREGRPLVLTEGSPVQNLFG